VADVSLVWEWAADMVGITAAALNDAHLLTLGDFQPFSCWRAGIAT
jgi:hypothetical protein